MDENLAYDLTGAWDLNYNTNKLDLPLTSHMALNFVRDGPPIREEPRGYRARFISRVAGPPGEQVMHAEVFTGLRPPTQVSPDFPLTVVTLYQADPGLRGRYPYYSSWSGCLIVDYHTDPKHPKDTRVVEGYYADIELSRGRFEMKKRA